MRPIPRTTLTLPPRDILAFMRNLFVSMSEEDSRNVIARFESEFARRYGMARGVAVSKARVAFYLLMKKMRLRAGGEVILSGIHVADFVNMITLAGFTPVVADLKDGSYCVDYDDLERKITSRTVLFLVTHLAGYSHDMERIMEISRRHGVPFIEDCSQAVSTLYRGQCLGMLGRAAFFSLSLLKPVCTLSGGMIISRDEELLAAIRREASAYPTPAKLPLIQEAVKNLVLMAAVGRLVFRYLTFPLLRLTMSGADYFSRYQKTNKTVELRDKMPESFLVSFSWQQAVMGLSQLGTLEDREARRMENGAYLYANIRSTSSVRLPSAVEGSRSSFWLFPVLTDIPQALKIYLARHGVDSSMMLLSAVAEEPEFAPYRFSCATAANTKARTLFIPGYAILTEAELDSIAELINSYSNIRSEGDSCDSASCAL
jgi:dTDP-4-amino-4,6-dideoxygalactose transaminase